MSPSRRCRCKVTLQESRTLGRLLALDRFTTLAHVRLSYWQRRSADHLWHLIRPPIF